ncbi:MAG: hypothetical protein SV760_04245, partial [Halobacteria archaeon]|nr:hypothetical protein [Halobacteria archaeon]
TRITLVPEPTLNLITAFMIELATVWVAVYVFAGLTDKKVTLGLDPKASVGIAYASAVLLIPPPTLSRSYEFVFTAVSTGFVGLTVLPSSNGRSRKAGETSYLGSLVTYARPEYHRRWIAGLTTDDVFSAVVTGVSAVTLAVVGYGVSYVVITLVL